MRNLNTLLAVLALGTAGFGPNPAASAGERQLLPACHKPVCTSSGERHRYRPYALYNAHDYEQRGKRCQRPHRHHDYPVTQSTAARVHRF